jgi:hypothetical protein
MSTETAMKCPVPRITDALGRDTATQPSPVHFQWGVDRVGIPRQLMHQMPRYDTTFPTGSYAGKMFLRGKQLWWIQESQRGPDELAYKFLEYEETGEYGPNPHLEPCPLCHGEAYCGFEAKHSGDRVKFHITCEACGLTFGNYWKIGLQASIANSVEVMGLWNNRQPRP